MEITEFTVSFGSFSSFLVNFDWSKYTKLITLFLFVKKN